MGVLDRQAALAAHRVPTDRPDGKRVMSLTTSGGWFAPSESLYDDLQPPLPPYRTSVVRPPTYECLKVRIKVVHEAHEWYSHHDGRRWQRGDGKKNREGPWWCP